MTKHPDIAVVGGGPAGMIAALVFANLARSVALVDPTPPGQAPQDLRSTAFLAPSLQLLEEAGILDALRPHGAALETMRLGEVEASGMIGGLHDFTAAEAGLDMFGMNFANTQLKAALSEAVGAHPGIPRHITKARSVLGRSREAVLWLEDGTRLNPALAVAADGRNSALREQAGIATRTMRYGQKAIVFAVRHEAAHQNISTELHRTGGPFTLVPLPGDDQQRSAVVWMDSGPEVARRAVLDDAAFIAEAHERSGGILGRLDLITGRAVWPIIAQHATGLTSSRLALIAEAAHVVPPIGAQGLNMSLQDIACLASLIEAAPARDAIGNTAFLATYERRRLTDIRTRVTGIDALNRMSQTAQPDLRRLRAAGMKLLADTRVLRRTAMSAGLGGARRSLSAS